MKADRNRKDYQEMYRAVNEILYNRIGVLAPESMIDSVIARVQTDADPDWNEDDIVIGIRNELNDMMTQMQCYRLQNQKGGSGMDLKHAKEILNNIINHICVATPTVETLRQLLFFGFTKEDLLEFEFSEADIDEAIRQYESDNA